MYRQAVLFPEERATTQRTRLSRYEKSTIRINNPSKAIYDQRYHYYKELNKRHMIGFLSLKRICQIMQLQFFSIANNFSHTHTHTQLTFQVLPQK